MFKRLFWLFVGMGFGFGASFWVMRALRRTASRLTVDATADILAKARQIGDELSAALGARLGAHDSDGGLGEAEAGPTGPEPRRIRPPTRRPADRRRPRVHRAATRLRPSVAAGPVSKGESRAGR
jgi:hypothetical protein